MAEPAGYIVGVVGQVQAVEGVGAVVAGVGQDGVVAFHRPFAGGASAGGGAVAPDDFADYIPGAEHGVHHHLDVVAGGGVAVEIDAAGGFEEAVDFQQADAHNGEIGGRRRAAGVARGGDDGVQAVVDAFELLNRHFLAVVQRPDVIEGGAFRRAADGGGVVAVGIERRVQVDEIYGGAVDAAHNGQVVAGKDGAVGDVGGVHSLPSIQQFGINPAVWQRGNGGARGRRGE